jgi:O-antigen/teichoic acid export membrane protein
MINQSEVAAGATAEAVVPAESSPAAQPHKDLKQRTARGAVVSVVAQAATFVLRISSMVILARLLLPKEFGLVGMVTAVTGFLALFKDVGLSMATVQRVSITEAQTSTLFWINAGLGVGLAVISAALAPVLAAFYTEPRLVWVTVALGTAFIFNGFGAQHRALLQRRMRFSTIALIDLGSLVVSTGAGIASAALGLGYWALVVMAVSQPAATLLGVWVSARWKPGIPQRGCGVGSMLRYGGTVTLNTIVVYMAYNAEKVLLGRFWGAETLGIYGRAYQLINLPTENLNSTIGGIAFPALCRVQDDPVRLRSYFLKGYTLFLSLVMPLTMGSAIFAEDIIRVALGVKWGEAAPIFRLLAPTMIAFALINPMAWLMLATGRAVRSLNIAFMIAPVVIAAYVLGLGKGPHGVAIGFSAAMMVLVVPVIAWSRHGTNISGRDILKAAMIPLIPVLAGAAAALAIKGWTDQLHPVLVRLIVANSVLFGVYLLVLLFVMKQYSVYLNLFRQTGLWPLRFGAPKS